MKVYFTSLGCRLNQAEIEELARDFAAAGWTVTDTPSQATVCVLNTCAVTGEAERKTRRAAVGLARANPNAHIAAIGCYATLAPNRCAALPGVTWVVSNAAKDATRATIEASILGNGGLGRETTAGSLPKLRTRATVKVQDGCDNHCTYCIIKLLRGTARSRPVKDVVSEVQALVNAEYHEVVLAGANLASYGRDLPGNTRLDSLIRAILADTDLPRLRLSSLESWDLDETFFRCWEDPRLCRQLHLPLQAGCDETLRRMGRRTTVDAYWRLVTTARAAIPGLAVSTDVMVGFPGEDEAAFNASYAFVARLNPSRLHVFPYSPRPGTTALRLPGAIPRPVRARRARTLRALGAQQAQRFCQQFAGQEMIVLWERRQPSKPWTGLTDNYLRVTTRDSRTLANRLTRTRLSLQDGQLIGEILE